MSAPPTPPDARIRSALLAVLVASGTLVGPLAAASGAASPPGSSPAPSEVCGGPAAARDGRPRVALVLSGGGALGLAHVGVVQVLEELRVPVDCVAGTSMGAIVGGLYAAGASPAELERYVHVLPWRELIQDQPDRRHIPYRRKVDDLTYLTRWEIGVSRRGFQLPSGLIAGHRLGATLQRLTLRAVGVEDFDRLPLPFRATATDAGTGEAVSLAGGDLARALRASMAVPALFAPVEIDGRLLIDGGVAENLPVAAARAMGAEVVIAVDLAEPLGDRERPASLPAILQRTAAFISRREVERALADADIVIRPQLGDWGLLDFDVGPQLVQRGGAAARDQTEALSRLAVDESAWSRHLARQRRTEPTIPIRNVIVEPGPGLPQAVVRRAVQSRPGRALDPLLLESDLERLWELDEFDTVDFGLAPTGDGAWDLTITGRPKALGPGVLRTGLSLASDLEGSSRFSLLGALTVTRLNRLGGELKVSTEIGESPVLALELYQPLVASWRTFASLIVQGAESKTGSPVDGRWVQYRAVQEAVFADLGLSLGRYGEARLGLWQRGTEARPFGEGARGAPRVDRDEGGWRANLVIDQLDRINFPRSGLLAFAEHREADPSIGGDAAYRRFDLQAVGAATVGRHSLVVLLHGTSALGGELPPDDPLALGGLFQLSGLPEGSVHGSYGGVASLVYLYRLGKLPSFVDGYYAGVSLEAGNAWDSSRAADLDDLRTAWALVFGADTILGPVYLAHGRSEGGSDSFYFYLGRSF